MTFVRVFEDGDFAFAHNEYDFASLRVAFEVFRFEDGKGGRALGQYPAQAGPQSLRRGMLDGATEIVDLDRTETNRASCAPLPRGAGRPAPRPARAVSRRRPDPAQSAARRRGRRAPRGARGHNRWSACDPLRPVHKVLAEGNFVLTISEGHRGGVHSSFYDLCRVAGGRIVEHWDTIEAIPRAANGRTRTASSDVERGCGRLRRPGLLCPS